MKFIATVLFICGVLLFSGCGSSEPVEQLSAEKRFAVGKAKGMMESVGLRVLSVRNAGPYHYLILAGA